MIITPTGCWTTNTPAAHHVDERLATAMASLALFEKSDVVDFGCGTGYYVGFLRSKGFTCDGYDGNPNTETLSGGIGKVLDLSKTIDLGKQYDIVVSLEVGEHIPAEFEQVFIDNVVRHAKKRIILSWAVEGQPGTGHVNCRNNDYVIAELAKRGFRYNYKLAMQLRAAASPDFWWFKNTVMVFEREHDK